MKKIWGNKKIAIVIKLVFCILTVVWLSNCMYVNALNSCIGYSDYTYQNELMESVTATNVDCIKQQFSINGEELSDITLYFGDVYDTELCIEIANDEKQIVFSKNINVFDYNSNAWNRISIGCKQLKKSDSYTISLKGNELSYLFLNTESEPDGVLTSCYVNNAEVPYTLAIGMHSIDRYPIWEHILQLIISLFFMSVLCISLCYSIFNVEKIYKCYINTEKKQGFLYALYFSVYTVLFFNPLKDIRNEVTEFNRVMGGGFNDGVDVSKRISNFSYWFIFLAITFVLYFLLANYLKSKKLDGENKKVALLLDNVIVIANVILGFRCITYFYDTTQGITVFYYSDFLIMTIILLSVSYIIFGFGKKICVESFEALILSGWMLVLPFCVLVKDGNIGSGLMAFQVFVAVALVLIVSFVKIDWNRKWISTAINTSVVFMSLIPFFTSFYFEFIILLNQRGIFLTHIKKYYVCACVIGILITEIIVFVMIKKDKSIKKWKCFVYPSIIFGISCLWCQIPISTEYGADIVETANSSILISDFLNFGDIPIVQHYGGHMMSGVWEGLIYAVLNNDFVGAVLSPYSGYIATVVAVLFYIFIKHVWDEDSAIIVALFFPFYDSISYWGLGILIGLAAIAYVKKNTIFRAAMFWLACIWCAIYRLDLGFSFIVAAALALAIYIIIERNLVALKQLILTLIGWGAIGLLIWSVICIAKGINPISRLLEFLYVSFSNQNWAYSVIGNPTLAKFGWAYLFVPFTVVICLIYVVFSKKIKRNADRSTWILLLILGFSYFFNFSRGLVRHSLAEGVLIYTIWCAYIFIALFLATLLSNKKLIIPVFAGFILINCMFETDEVFSYNCIADKATTRVGTYIESFQFENNEVIERVKLSPYLAETVEKYQIMIDELLEDDETFVDFINKTTIYSLMNRRNPVYVSQSPLQLSGQFTQEQYVKEMQGVPIVLMPYYDDEALAESLDGVSNLYRYYKVAEYIYQNYVPLCTYENLYAIWCLPERYDEMAKKVERMATGIEVMNGIAYSEELSLSFSEIIKNEDGTFSINSTGTKPMVAELQNVIDTTPYLNNSMTVAIEYESDVLGDMQIYYTTEFNENYTDEKVSTATLKNNKGVAYFEIPINEYTRIRLDTPEESCVKINSLKVGAYNCKLADYGYDGPYVSSDGESYSYALSVHNYDLSKLPLIWAKGDSQNCVDNTVITDLTYNDGYYIYDLDKDKYGTDGNYLKVNLTYEGLDQSGKVASDDETVYAEIKIGKLNDGKFETKYNYSFVIREGQNDYIFRISNDYYWYTNDTNAIKIKSAGQLLNVKMQILEGD